MNNNQEERIHTIPSTDSPNFLRPYDDPNIQRLLAIKRSNKETFSVPSCKTHHTDTSGLIVPNKKENKTSPPLQCSLIIPSPYNDPKVQRLLANKHSNKKTPYIPSHEDRSINTTGCNDSFSMHPIVYETRVFGSSLDYHYPYENYQLFFKKRSPFENL